MTDLNEVVLMGRVTRELGERDFGYVGNGQAKLTISIAVNRSVKHGDEWADEVSFFNVTYWGKPAENIKPYITKGSQVIVKGYLKQEHWEKDGQKHSAIGIVAERVYLCGGKHNDEQSQTTSGTKFTPVNNNQNNGNDFQEDIPFDVF